MKRTAHTPGPWTPTHSHGSESELFDLERSVYAGDVPIAAVAGQAPGGPREWSANARLLAAAPDLLDACRAVVAWGERVGALAQCSPHWPAVVEQAKAAILKAEGGEL